MFGLLCAHQSAQIGMACPATLCGTLRLELPPSGSSAQSKQTSEQLGQPATLQRFASERLRLRQQTCGNVESKVAYLTTLDLGSVFHAFCCLLERTVGNFPSTECRPEKQLM